ncbi:MAG: FAD/NAD(P)-binding protein [Nitrospirae bacterium]|nr:FAD/NAD(P)-binding protein [Nitrospirota bacterium]
MKNKLKELYLPSKAKVMEVIGMTSDVKLFRVMPENPFKYTPGQFVMFSLWGAGEVPISITSTYGVQKHIELCIKRVGYVTSAIHCLKSGDDIGIRGPFGNAFPISDAKGKDILFVAGGIGIAPLRSLINEVIKNKKDFRKIELIYGSRNPSEVLFIDDINAWQKKGINIILTVDRKDKGWKGYAGIVTEHLNKTRVSFKSAHAFICGPHIMIEAAMRGLSSMGMQEDNIITTLEAHMKCGVGKCGHCYADGRYICTDGPVFSYRELKQYNLNSP